MKKLIAAALLALTAAAAANADICPAWSPAHFAGELDTALINEASGLAASRAITGRLYHNNDSGDSGRFFATDGDGANTRVVNVANYAPIDMEELALGPCAEGTCLYLGDIGDNFRRRETITFTVLREKQRFAAAERALRTITARYPDGAHYAEAFAIHPQSGDLYLVTKPADFTERRVTPAQVFRLNAAQLRASGTQTFERVGEIDLPYLLWEQPMRGLLATGMDFSPDGARAALVTYTVALEFAFDASAAWKPSRSWRPNIDYRVIPLPRLPQAEAIAYAADGEALIVDTEFNQAFGQAPLYRIACQRAPRAG